MCSCVQDILLVVEHGTCNLLSLSCIIVFVTTSELLLLNSTVFPVHGFKYFTSLSPQV